MTTHELAAMLNARGVRPTQQRIAVYGYLIDHSTHPTADTIYHALAREYPTFSRTTIYNSLRALIEARLIRPVLIDAEEQRFDGNPLDHGHFKCVRCGEIYDFDLDAPVLRQMCPPGFRAEIQDVYYTGVCADCEAAFRIDTHCSEGA